MLLEDVGVLVVDDVNTMRIQIKELLKTFGLCKVTLASNGEEAKQVIGSSPIQLVLVDWQMKPTDGLELLKYLRLHPQHKQMAVIMVTAENTKELVGDAIKAGVDDYLLKPLTLVQIRNKIYGVLLKRGLLS